MVTMASNTQVDPKLQRRLANVKNIIIVLSGKGGVGTFPIESTRRGSYRSTCRQIICLSTIGALAVEPVGVKAISFTSRHLGR